MRTDNLTEDSVQALNQSPSRDVFSEGKTKKCINSSYKTLSVDEVDKKVESIKKLTAVQSVDKERVKRLQKLIDNKQYEVDAQGVADRLVDSHLEIFE